MMSINEISVRGSAVQSFCNICINLEYIARKDLMGVVRTVTDPNGWYPFSILSNLFDLVAENYGTPDVVFELIGQETMRLWYEQGEGHDKIKRGVDFLRYQSGSRGYWSMVKGPEENVGAFMLESLDEQEGKAILTDTSPFHPAFVKGIIIGGMKGPGDLMWVNIRYSVDNRSFDVSFNAI